MELTRGAYAWSTRKFPSSVSLSEVNASLAEHSLSQAASKMVAFSSIELLVVLVVLVCICSIQSLHPPFVSVKKNKTSPRTGLH